MDADAQNLMRKASIAQTVTKGNWDGQGTFRDKLKDEAQAVSLEQAAKVVTSGDMTQRLLEEGLALVVKEPGNLNHYRTRCLRFEFFPYFRNGFVHFPQNM